MDPVTAVGLASAVVQIVDFGSRLVSKSVEAYKSAQGSTRHDSDIKYIVTKFQELNSTLKYAVNASSASGVLSPSQHALQDLASECSILSDELLVALDALQTNSGHRVLRSVRTALKSLWNKEKIDSMKARFDAVKSQLQFAVLVQMSSEMRELGFVQSQRFNELNDHMKSLTNALVQSSDQFIIALESQRDYLDMQFRNTQSTIVDEGERTRQHIDLSLRQIVLPSPVTSLDNDADLKRQSWLQSLHGGLYYQEIDARQDAIKPHHKQTCEWIFDENKSFSSTGPNFIEWLRAHGGIYWINGKAGSGKSTLMNFIAEDDRLQQALDLWAGDAEICQGNFFFCKSGTDLQKTIDGLLRSVLFQTLNSCPTLLEIVLGKLYMPRIDADKYSWSPRKLQDCFKRLLSQTRVKIFLLIDGLDEFAGEHLEIIELLHQASTEPNIKICLSSRPWTIFQRAFETSPGLRVQELTEDDIMAFVRDKLNVPDLAKNEAPSKRSVHQNIANTIIEKADGVFIWVETVVRSIQKGYISEDSPEHLLARVQALPPEILDLYLPLLRRVEEIYLPRQHRILETIRFSNSEIERDSFHLSALFVQAMENASEVAIRAPMQDSCVQDIMERRRRAKAQVEACCMGLIEVDDDGFLKHAHETVREFLQLPAVKEELAKRIPVPNFNPARAFLKSAIILIEQGLMEAPPGGKSGLYVLIDNNDLLWCIEAALQTVRCLEHSENCAEAQLLDRLDQAVSHWYKAFIQREASKGNLGQAVAEYWTNRHWSAVIMNGYMLGTGMMKGDYENLRNFSDAWTHSIPLDFVGLAARYHLQNYVDVKLYLGIARLLKGFKPSELPDPSSVLLQYLRPGYTPFINGIPKIKIAEHEIIATVKTLLSHGADPNARFGPESPWTCCLGAFTHIMESMWPSSWAISTAMNVIQLLLERGADPSLDFWILRDRAWRSANYVTIVRMSAVDVVFQYFKKFASEILTAIAPLVEDDDSLFMRMEKNPLLKQFAKFQNTSVTKLVERQRACSVFRARVIQLRVHGLDYANRIVIDDDSHLLSDIDLHYAGGSLDEETIDTSVNFTKGWEKLEFCGLNAARAKEAHEFW